MANQLRSLWQNMGRLWARKLWHAARRGGHDIGRDQVARLMKIARISGVLRGKHRTITTRRDDAAPRHPDLVKRGWAAPTGIDTPTCGPWPVSATSRSLSMCSPAGSWAGGSPPPSTPAWSPTPSGRRCRSATPRRTRLGGRRFDPSFRRRVAIRRGRLHRRTARRRDRRLDRHLR